MTVFIIAYFHWNVNTFLIFRKERKDNMTKEDYIKAAEMVKPYQERINAILAEYKEEFIKEFGQNFNYTDYYIIKPLFNDTEENIKEAGGEKEFETERLSFKCKMQTVFYSICDQNGDSIPNIMVCYTKERGAI